MNPSTTKQPKLATYMKKNAIIDVKTAFGGSVLWCWQRVDDLKGDRTEKRRQSSAQAWQMLGDLGHYIWPDIAGDGTYETVRQSSGQPGLIIDGVTHCASISHSRDLVAVAIAKDPDAMIGIDIEYRDPSRDIDALSRWLFDGDADGRDFYQGWCDYEAAFKATGETDPVMQSRATLIAIETMDGFSGALARLAA
ncbi:MAG: hypothetical protein CMO03_06355 [Thalassospira sp.]|jgi:4'-phosphopantetheinyl transferase|uniref:4'-phosphopantetheinyl transferase n=2 Tax=Thalassospiraceae TaxID=2844866 RepID=A0ABR5XXQ5_9PROT|nr:hypothetical protein AUP40_03310 [Thalassospira xiamenensis]KZD06739.1 hypothetical protein AUP45_19600 [Thalassospira xiamenensis]MAL29139.1 hypothetical protein [Thalassospira sp.]HBN51493.1 hypothetical protein [Thalassospira sp.]|tara:strand:- start:12333 stop:12917 length:585 start_codon:yes stop_codon:yes gene_type:complete